MEGNFFDKIRMHWAYYAVGVIATVIGITWNVEHELFVAPRDDEISRLKQRVSELEEDIRAQKTQKSPAVELTPQDQTTQDQTPQDQTTQDQTTQDQTTQEQGKHLTDWSREGSLFDKGSPYPKNYDKVKIGTKISVMKNIYPFATYTSATHTWYIELIDGPFQLLRFAVNNSFGGNDPKITSMILYFRYNPNSLDVDQNARQYVIEQALKHFGTDTVISKMLGEEMEWPSIKGLRVKIDTFHFTLSQATNN